MIDDNGEAILMDFGSTVRARIYIADRRQALTQQVCLRLLPSLVSPPVAYTELSNFRT